MNLQIFNNEKIELKIILELIPILYAVFSCLSILYFIGYYNYFDALWLIKDLSIPTLLIYTTFQMIGFIFGLFLAIQFFHLRKLMEKKYTFTTVSISTLIVWFVSFLLYLVSTFLNLITADSITFLLLYCAAFPLASLFLLNLSQPLISFKYMHNFILVGLIGLTYYASGYFNANCKIQMHSFYMISTTNSIKNFYMLEKQNDHIIAFRKSPTTDKFEYKIIKNDDVVSLSK